MHGLGDLPLLTDNQHYFFIAERAASGVPPYVSQFEPKHALASLLNAAAIWIGRQVDAPDLTSARALSVIVTAASAPMAWLLARRVGVRSWAAHLAALSILASPAFIYMGAIGARPKVFLVLLELLTLYAMAADRPVVAAAAASLAFLTWQPALIFFACIFAVLCLGPAPARRAGACALVFLAINAAYEAYFYSHGALAEQIEQAYVFPAEYMRTGLPATELVLRRLGWILDVLPRVGWASVFPLAAGLGFICGWAAALASPRAACRRFLLAPGLLYAALCGHLALFLTLADFQSYPDEFLLLPFLALSVAMGIERLRSRIVSLGRPGFRMRWVTLGAGLIVFAATVGASPREAGLREQRELAKQVGTYLDDGLTVYAVGCSHLLAYNHSDNFLPFGFFFRGLDRYLVRRYGTWPFHPYRDGALPDVILFSRGRSRFGTTWMDRHYVRVQSPLADEQNVRIWRRRTDAEATSQTSSGGRL